MCFLNHSSDLIFKVNLNEAPYKKSPLLQSFVPLFIAMTRFPVKAQEEGI